MTIERIVSGGQTGVDRAALDAAMQAGIPVGGWCSKGRRAEDGTIPERYPLSETPSRRYAQRTAWNVRDSDGTLILHAGTLEGGTALTKTKARSYGRPTCTVAVNADDADEQIRAWVESETIRVLNIAGPRESEVPGIYESARRVLTTLLSG